jgi:sugar O-acyltransferase (sialic acid O-acetyltransferase NeuD family)
MTNIVVFGTSANAELAHYYLSNDSPHKVVGFCVDARYLPAQPTFQGLPVCAFEEVESVFTVHDHAFIAPLTAASMNRVREDVYRRIKAKGYPLISYVSSHATVLTKNIGDNCFILENNTVQPFVTLGNNVVLWSGNHLGHHSRVHDHVFFTSQVTMSGFCEIGAYSFLGVNSALRDGLAIAEGTFVAMGACVTRDTAAWTAYGGNPARSLGKRSTEVEIYHAVDQAR